MAEDVVEVTGVSSMDMDLKFLVVVETMEWPVIMSTSGGLKWLIVG